MAARLVPFWFLVLCMIILAVESALLENSPRYSLKTILDLISGRLINSNKDLLHDKRLALGLKRHWALVHHHVKILQVQAIGPNFMRLAAEQLMQSAVPGGEFLKFAAKALSEGTEIAPGGLSYIENLAIAVVDINAARIGVSSQLVLFPGLACLGHTYDKSTAQNLSLRRDL
jgi:hypothetical protein